MASFLHASLCLLSLLGTLCIAMPVVQRQDTLSNHLISIQSGLFVHVHEEEGNVTTAAFASEGFVMGKFFIRGQENVSLKHGESYLHFVQFVPVNSYSNSSQNVSDEFSINGTNASNDSISNSSATETNTTETNITATNVTSSSTLDTIPNLKLVLEAVTEDEEGTIRHLEWNPEWLSSHLVRLSITLEDGKVCYLAFETDGSPVENPCRTDLMRKDIFHIIPAFF